MSNNRYRSWCFTVNNYTEEEYQKLKDTECKYIIIGKEEGKEGTPHLQGYIQFGDGKSLERCKKINERAHWERARGNPQQNYDYCSKEGNFWEKGTLPKVGKRTIEERAALNKKLIEDDLKELVYEGIISAKEVRAIKNARYDLLIQQDAKETEGTRGVWIHGPPGLGKTHWIEQKLKEQYGRIYKKEENKWWDGYQGESAVLLDDLSKDNHLGQKLKRWLDKYSATGEVKGGQVPLQHEVFAITSNYVPEDIWPDDHLMAEAIRGRCQIIDFSHIYNGPIRRKTRKLIDYEIPFRGHE